MKITNSNRTQCRWRDASDPKESLYGETNAGV